MHMAETSAAKQLPIFRSTVMKDPASFVMYHVSVGVQIPSVWRSCCPLQAIKEVIYDSGPMLESRMPLNPENDGSALLGILRQQSRADFWSGKVSTGL